MYLERVNILIVEDNLGDFILIQEHIRDCFMQANLVNADTMNSAMNALAQESYDIILLDLTLPDCKGIDSIRQMVEQAGRIPVIVLTGYNNQDFGIACLKLGVQDYLIKDDITGPIIEKSISYAIERKRNQQEMLQREKRFRALIENSADGLALLTVNGGIIELSSSACKIIGFTLDEISSMKVMDMIHHRDVRKVYQAFESVLTEANTILPVEFRGRTRSGAYIWLEATFQNLLHEPDVQAIVFNFRDISIRKHEEADRQQLIEELTKSYDDLRQFTYITSHNLRAPLTNLMLVMNLINWDAITDPELKIILEAFKSSTNQLDETLNDLFQILLIKQDKSTTPQPVSLENNLRLVLQQDDRQIKAAGAQIHFNFKEAGTVLFDDNYLKSIFHELIENSLRFAQNQVRPVIQVHSQISGNQVKVVFSDNGIGINLRGSTKERIFGLYQRFHQHRSRKGFGLHMIHTKLTSMGGSIAVTSEENAGTVFTLTFKR